MGPRHPFLPIISRDASGRATIRAVRLTTAIRIDGALDEPIYTMVPPITDFIPQEPVGGEPATEKTELWVAFDETTCTSAGRRTPVASWPTRCADGPNMWQGNDLVAVSFDTFLDRRNSFNFVMNALSGRTDGQVTNERPGFCRTDSLRHSVRCDITRCTRAAAS